MATVFFSYSHADQILRDQLEVHLSGLKRQGLIEAWHDRQIQAGETLHDEISEHLESADVILLLVSSDFLNSDYCYQREMQRALERNSAEEAIVIPVILRPCDWQDTPFRRLLAVPRDGKPITLWPNIDEAFLDVVSALKRALQKHGAPSGSPQILVIPHRNAEINSPSTDVRSSNLRVARRFSEQDRDQFLRDAFDYIALFFDNSLGELQSRHTGIVGTFRRIDANRFTAVVYREGRAVARCTIFFGGRNRSGGIAYAANDSGETNSWNESLSVSSDDQILFLEATGMSRYTREGESEKLSFQGASELFWALFINPLQRN